MLRETIEEIEREITRLRLRHGAFLRQVPEAQELLARWAAEAADLRWFVPLDDVVEADIDVEITREVLIVRASRTWPDPAELVGILPVPHGFDLEHPVIRYVEGTLEVRVHRVLRRSAR